jgi:hypothetical protein
MDTFCTFALGCLRGESIRNPLPSTSTSCRSVAIEPVTCFAYFGYGLVRLRLVLRRLAPGPPDRRLGQDALHAGWRELAEGAAILAATSPLVASRPDGPVAERRQDHGGLPAALPRLAHGREHPDGRGKHIAGQWTERTSGAKGSARRCAWRWMIGSCFWPRPAPGRG